ncbi:MAG TPA: hypothetical protein PLA68_11330 [Panacibacter sp.]|nr:hypothetical protein [Panacibacter sp.]
MKTFKRLDVFFQSLLVLFAIASLYQNNPLFESYTNYFIVGGWQFTSMLVHEFAGSFTAKGGRRRHYQNAVYIIVLCMLAGMAIPPFLFIFFILVFAAPLMAVYYLYMCYDETYHYMQRPLSQLK